MKNCQKRISSVSSRGFCAPTISRFSRSSGEMKSNVLLQLCGCDWACETLRKPCGGNRQRGSRRMAFRRKAYLRDPLPVPSSRVRLIDPCIRGAEAVPKARANPTFPWPRALLNKQAALSLVFSVQLNQAPIRSSRKRSFCRNPSALGGVDSHVGFGSA